MGLKPFSLQPSRESQRAFVLHLVHFHSFAAMDCSTSKSAAAPADKEQITGAADTKVSAEPEPQADPEKQLAQATPVAEVKAEETKAEETKAEEPKAEESKAEEP